MIRPLLALTLAMPLASFASTYPLTLTDVDGQKVTLTHEPQRVVLQDGRDILALALLDRQSPFHRVVAWNNMPKKQDIQSWDLLRKTWPEAEKITDMGFSDQGEINLETVLSKKTDLVIAQWRAKPALKQTGVLAALAKLNIPVLFVDYELEPVKNTKKSIELLGKALNKEKEAQSYATFYQERLDAILSAAKSMDKTPTVFIEPIAGNTENCCFTHSHNGWGGLVEAVGGRNIGSELLPGNAGFVSLEKVISMKPDVYIMSGSRRPNVNVLPFGYGVTPQQVSVVFNKLKNRQGLNQIQPIQDGNVYGVYHHFYNHPYNIIGMEIIAKDLYQGKLNNLDPLNDYHHIIRDFTKLPDENIILSYP
ncbi:MAG: ABC transporter substrate-binding protein [Pantoea sp.]|uniref:ABC transporter substrate-binding protein n=1 Tax=Pantoea sp. TaxID=69393 RepID=UPI002398DBD7|nr:ABC transporter substrate-binding protein [Pantoea sp.]MDE1185450.1 ABC transporter substrate-binding protein [Pantoea sp.]